MEECDCYPPSEDHEDIAELVDESEPTVKLPPPVIVPKPPEKKVVSGGKPVAKKKAIRLSPAKQRSPKA
jgi:hypothetical protein